MQIKNLNKYNLSFTAGGLLLQESVNVATVFIESYSWEVAQKSIMDNNILKTRTSSTAKRLYYEISLRLKKLPQETIEYLINSTNEDEKKQILWYCICKRYPLISDFSKEVLQKKILSLDYTLSSVDYDRFFNQKAQWHCELEKISTKTSKKIKQVLFKMLKEVGYLTETGELIPKDIHSYVLDLVLKDEKNFQNIFLIPPLYLHKVMA